jgi:hypothetical protein
MPQVTCADGDTPDRPGPETSTVLEISTDPEISTVSEISTDPEVSPLLLNLA